MSDRKIDQASGLAALRVAHEAQIEALLAPGLPPTERVVRFSVAAGFSEDSRLCALINLCINSTAAAAVWMIGTAPLSLFAALPGCWCPVSENSVGPGVRFPGIPDFIPDYWAPSREVLERFAQVQQAARFPEAH